MFLQLQQFPAHQHILAEVLFYSDLYNKCHISKTTNQTFVNFPRFPTQLVVLSCHQILINMISNTCKTTAGFFPLCVSEVYKPCVCTRVRTRVCLHTRVRIRKNGEKPRAFCNRLLTKNIYSSTQCYFESNFHYIIFFCSSRSKTAMH